MISENLELVFKGKKLDTKQIATMTDLDLQELYEELSNTCRIVSCVAESRKIMGHKFSIWR